MSMNRSPLKAIRNKCLDCSGGMRSEVRLCPQKNCPLWPFRSGHRLPKETIEGACGFEENASETGVLDESDNSGEEEEE